VNGGTIRASSHQPVEHVELTDEVPLSDTTYRRIARHLAHILGPEGQESDASAPASRGGRSFAPGMAGADHQNVVHQARIAQECFT
jgi:hypothetical protein